MTDIKNGGVLFTCVGFPPNADAECTLLILGSMPGEASLTLAQYYGHPRNRFWRLLAMLCTPGRPAPEKYEERLAMLLAHHIALWDTLASCERSGSLDSAIRRGHPNNIAELLARCKKIRTVCCNGAKAYETFRRYNKELFARRELKIFSLPSTSPANARWTLNALYAEWSKAFEAQTRK